MTTANHDSELMQILVEIRDNQRLSLQKQDEHLEIARQQIERARTQVAESIELQKVAIERAKMVARVAIPGILLCIGLVIYLIVTYL
ncbi:MAG: hypothetical protein QNJ73_04285 [Gammaproteobacteria bacterium]|nr:hypothetical protein [Gammaproteobacteria bacterium]